MIRRQDDQSLGSSQAAGTNIAAFHAAPNASFDHSAHTEIVQADRELQVNPFGHAHPATLVLAIFLLSSVLTLSVFLKRAPERPAIHR